MSETQANSNLAVLGTSRRPLVLLHGYSDNSNGLNEWKGWLEERGAEVVDLKVANYITLSNEITVRDIAEGFQRALQSVDLDSNEEFDAIVHSTGMLVIRAWLTTYGQLSQRRSRLKHLIGLAPATFGSPLAHKGRSFMGSIVKGNQEFGPDQREVGDLVLDNLELASRYTWTLAHEDLVGPDAVYGDGPDTPYPFIFVGTDQYGGIRGLVANEPGTDGTVRWAGAGFNVRKVELDLTRDPSDSWTDRSKVRWLGTHVPLIFVPNTNHAQLLRKPPAQVLDAISAALRVESEAAYTKWKEDYSDATNHPASYQQFLTHILDERGDSVGDYFLQFGRLDEEGRFQEVGQQALSVHPYRADPSYRCFHVAVSDFGEIEANNAWIRIVASTGTQRVEYTGYKPKSANRVATDDFGHWTVMIDMSDVVQDEQFELIKPFSTTLIEIKINREPTQTIGDDAVTTLTTVS